MGEDDDEQIAMATRLLMVDWVVENMAIHQ